MGLLISKTAQHHEYIGRLIRIECNIYSCFVEQEGGGEKDRRVRKSRDKREGIRRKFLRKCEKFFFRDCGKDKRKIRAKEKKTTEKKNKIKRRSVNIR